MPVSSVPQVDADTDYLAHLTRESARFGEAIATAPSGAPVLSCPGWTADDLLWHLAWVQFWWATIVRQQVTGLDARQLLPERPPARPELLTFYQQASQELQRVLSTVAPGTPGPGLMITPSDLSSARRRTRR